MVKEDNLKKTEITMDSLFTPTYLMIFGGSGFATIVILLLLILLCQRMMHHRRSYRQTPTRVRIYRYMYLSEISLHVEFKIKNNISSKA